MLTLSEIAAAFVASRDWNSATLGRVQFWTDELGDIRLTQITDDDVDAAVMVKAMMEGGPPFKIEKSYLGNFLNAGDTEQFEAEAKDEAFRILRECRQRGKSTAMAN